MKIMLSNGLRGKENPDQYVQDCRTALAKFCQDNSIQYELLHSYRPDQYKEVIGQLGEAKARVYMLGITITKELAGCDMLVLVDDWYNYDGCVVEFEIAKRYGKQIAFINTERTGI